MQVGGPHQAGALSGPTMPFHVARAYGAERSQGAPPSPESAGPARSDNIGRLIAGVTPGGIDFDAPAPVPGAQGLAMYRHPADKNAAATGVSLGRVLDVNG